MREKIHKCAVFCYHAGLIVFLFVLLLQRYNWTANGAGYLQSITWHYMDRLRILMSLLLAEKVFRKGVRAFPAIVLTAAVWWIGERNLLDICLFTSLSDLAEDRKTVRLILWFYTVVTLLTFLLNWTCSIEDKAVVFSYRTGHSLGFIHPNTLGGLMAALVLIIWYLYLQKHKRWSVLMCCSTAALIWLISASRTAALLVLLFPLLCFAMEAIEKGQRATWFRLVKWFPIICFVFSIGMTYTQVFRIVDWLKLGMPRNFWLRFDLPARVIRQNGITWLPPEGSWPSKALDAQYTNMLIYGGIVGCVLLAIQMTWCMAVSVRKKRIDLTTIMIFFSIYGIMECAPTILLWNFVPIILMSTEEKEECASSETGWIRMSARQKTILSILVACAAVTCAWILPERNEIPMKILTPEISRNKSGTILNDEMHEWQTFTAKESFSGIQVLAATYYTMPYGTLYSELRNQEGMLLEEIPLAGWNVRDNAYLSIPLKKMYPAGTYSFSIGKSDLVLGYASLWHNTEDAYPEGNLFQEGEATESDWCFRLYRGSISGRKVLCRDCLMISGILLAGIWMIPDLRKRNNSWRVSMGGEQTSDDPEKTGTV